MTHNYFSGLTLCVPGDPDLDEIYALRHSAYVAEGALKPRSDGRFLDRYDMLRTSTMIAVTEETGAVVGAIRFTVQPAARIGIGDYVSTPEFLIFPDALGQLAEDEGAVACGSRFSIEPGHRRRTQIALMLVLAQLEAARAVGARWGIATARGGHLAFYRRFLDMQPVCEPRPMPGLEYSYSLLSGEVERSYALCRPRFPEACRQRMAESAPDFHDRIRDAMPRFLSLRVEEAA